MSTPTAASDASMYTPELRAEVAAALRHDNLFDSTRIDLLVDFWFDNLGIPGQYFRHTPAADIAKNIQTFEASRILAQTSGRPFDIQLKHEEKDSAMFACRSFVTSQGNLRNRVAELDQALTPVGAIERYIEQKYLTGKSGPIRDEGPVNKDIPNESMSSFGAVSGECDPRIFRVQAFRTKGVVDQESNVHLRMYFLQAPQFANPTPKEGETSLAELADTSFLRDVDKETQHVYQRAMEKAVSTIGPVVEVIPKFSENEKDGVTSLVLIAHHARSTHSYFTGIPDVYRYYYMFADRKYVEPFSNDVVIFAFYLRSLNTVPSRNNPAGNPVENLMIRLAHIAEDASLHYVLPRTSLTPLLRTAKISVQQASYCYAAWKFAYHFLNRGSEAYRSIHAALKKHENSEADALAMLTKLQSAMKSYSFNEGMILDIIYRNIDIVRWLYDDFARRHMPKSISRSRSRLDSVRDSALIKDIESSSPMSEDEARTHLKRSCETEMDFAVFSAFLSFNRRTLKTNFYKPGKTALAFRLEPSFLADSDYPDKPVGVFFVVGSEFRGFHIRFHEIARGGVRMVRSRYMQAFAQNVASVFDECYNLASTQQRKNKDIPEGGSKGIVLLNLGHQDKDFIAFQKFVDSLLDLLLPDDTIVDHHGKEEILFLGPDEGTADYMDWASLHARKKDYRFWKAFTTGKSVRYGGIPHDTYGMTTQGVRAYVKGIQRKLGLDPKACFKVQTGGPDGDLGSNEIKLSDEKTIAVVDGSGVLYDPEGINHEELVRLADARKMVKFVDKTKLSPKGFLILVEETDVKLPDGTVIESGLELRNNFHLSKFSRGDFFVPCGGRPRAVSGENVKEFLHVKNGEGPEAPSVLRFKYVVEGANLFFTQDARLILEKAGVIVYKDASANKGGVTSSSLEVLAALSMNDTEFQEHMAVANKDAPPKFYEEYVREVQATIHNNADLEFECLWNEHARTGKSLSLLSDKLSTKITDLSDSIEESASLWDNEKLRNKVLRNAIPKVLQETIGFQTIVDRLPSTYTRALFASHLSSRFIYAAGLHTPEFAFFEFVQTYLKD